MENQSDYVSVQDFMNRMEVICKNKASMNITETDILKCLSLCKRIDAIPVKFIRANLPSPVANSLINLWRKGAIR